MWLLVRFTIKLESVYISLLIASEFCYRQDQRLLSRERSQRANLFPISRDKEYQNGKEKSQKKPLKRGIRDFYFNFVICVEFTSP